MATDAVRYRLDGHIATICIDDGKSNALSPAVLRGINRALDRAESDRATLIITGREAVFSAGFDLNVMKRGGMEALGMLKSGCDLIARVLAYPHPVVAACNGHVLAMGVFLMLSADYVVGTRGNFKVAANEVAIGLTLPRVAAAMLRHRLTPAAYQRSAILSEYFDVESAHRAGFFDELGDPGELMSRAQARAEEFCDLDQRAHSATKRRIRRRLIRRIRCRFPLDLLDAIRMGMRGTRSRGSAR
jgi:enoyl-CoA hydratase